MTIFDHTHYKTRVFFHVAKPKYTVKNKFTIEPILAESRKMSRVRSSQLLSAKASSSHLEQASKREEKLEQARKRRCLNKGRVSDNPINYEAFLEQAN